MVIRQKPRNKNHKNEDRHGNQGGAPDLDANKDIEVEKVLDSILNDDDDEIAYNNANETPIPRSNSPIMNAKDVVASSYRRNQAQVYKSQMNNPLASIDPGNPQSQTIRRDSSQGGEVLSPNEVANKYMQSQKGDNQSILSK